MVASGSKYISALVLEIIYYFYYSGIVRLAVYSVGGRGTKNKAVSHFFPGAFQHLPGVRPSSEIPELFMCGDWIDRGGHRSWSQVI